MSFLYGLFIKERKIFLFFSFASLGCGLFLLDRYLSIKEYSHFWWKCWLLGIVLLVITFSDITPSSFRSIHKKAAEFLKGFFHLHFQGWGYFAAFLVIIAFGLAFRLYRLDHFPWGLEGLEINSASVFGTAQRIVKGIKYIPIGDSGLALHDTLPYYYASLFMSLFGTKLFIFRCAALSIGIINAVLTYFVVRSLTNSILASLAGMALLTFSAVDTVLNYSFFENVISTPILLSCYLLLNLAIKRSRCVYFIIAGLCFGLGLSSSKYFLPIAPAIALMFIYHAAFNLRQVKSLANSAAFFSLGVFFVFSPKLIDLMYCHTGYFSRVWVVTTVDSSYEAGGIINAISEILSEIKPTLSLLFLETTSADRWLLGNTPIIHQLVSPLVIVGVIYAIVKIKDYKYFFLLCYFAFSVCLNASSYPADYRCIMFMPLPYIMAALALSLTDPFPGFRKIIYPLAGIYLLAIVFFNVKIYYEGMGVRPIKSLYNVKNVLLGRYLNETPLDEKVYVSLGQAHGAMLLILNDARGRDICKLSHEIGWRWEDQPCKENVYHRLLSNIRMIANENVRGEEDLLLIFDDAICHEEVIEKLKEVFKRDSSLLSIYSKSCKRDLTYFTFELEKKDLVRLLLPSYEDKWLPALKDPPDDELVGGIEGKYYEGTDLEKLVSTRTDKVIDFYWGGNSPLPLLAANDFSVRWDGFIKIDRDGENWLITESDDGVRLWVDGELVIDNWINHALEENIAVLNLDKGWHKMRLEYYEALGDSAITFYWEGEDRPKSIVPSDHLCCTSSAKD